MFFFITHLNCRPHQDALPGHAWSPHVQGLGVEVVSSDHKMSTNSPLLSKVFITTHLRQVTQTLLEGPRVTPSHHTTSISSHPFVSTLSLSLHGHCFEPERQLNQNLTTQHYNQTNIH